MRPSIDDYDPFAFDEIESLRRRARNRDLAMARLKARKRHLGPRDEDDFEDDDDWDDFDEDFDDYNEDEWDSYS